MASLDTEVAKALAVLEDMFGRELQQSTRDVYAMELEAYPPAVVLESLRRCYRELKSFPTLSDILARMEDSRPGPEEAWMMLPKSEDDSVVWTEEMAEAYGLVRHEQDAVAARMAFKEKYTKLVAEARRARKPSHWTASLGFDKVQQEAVLKEAVSRRRLTAGQAAALLPNGIAEPTGKLLLIGQDVPVQSEKVVAQVRSIAKQILKDAPAIDRVAEELRQRDFREEEKRAHEERVKKQLEELKKKEGGA